MENKNTQHNPAMNTETNAPRLSDNGAFDYPLPFLARASAYNGAASSIFAKFTTEIADSHGKTVCFVDSRMHEESKRAAFIVGACNSHADLLAALQKWQKAYAEQSEAFGEGSMTALFTEANHQTRAALAKALSR